MTPSGICAEWHAGFESGREIWHSCALTCEHPQRPTLSVDVDGYEVTCLRGEPCLRINGASPHLPTHMQPPVDVFAAGDKETSLLFLHTPTLRDRSTWQSSFVAPRRRDMCFVCPNTTKQRWATKYFHRFFYSRKWPRYFISRLHTLPVKKCL